MYQNNEEKGAATITNHLVKGGADSQIIAQYAELAGNNASVLSSYREAEKYYRIAFDNLGINYPDWQRVSFLLERLGECTRINGEFEEARHYFTQALEIHFNHRNISSVESKQEAQVQAMLLWEIGVTWYSQGETVQCRDYMERASQLLIDADLMTGIVWAKIKLQQSYVLWREGNYNQTKETANTALNMLYEVLDNQEIETKNRSYLSLSKRALEQNSVDVVRIYTLLCNVEASSGHVKEALLYLNKALSIAERYNSQREIAIISCNMGDLYLRTADYSQAQAAFRRSLSIAEIIGDLLLEMFNKLNMGIVDTRTGNLSEAVKEIEEVADLNKKINDQSLVCIIYNYLALAFLEKGNIKSSKEALYLALLNGRKTRMVIYTGLSLVILGYLRLVQSRRSKIEKQIDENCIENKKTLIKAKKTFKHVLELEGIEAETKIESRLGLSEALLQLGDIEGAYIQACQALEEANFFELNWLIARSQHALGNVFAIKKEHYEAIECYESALKFISKSSMRLYHGRILRDYGLFLLRLYRISEIEFHKGREYLNESARIFESSDAELDLEESNHYMTTYCLEAGKNPGNTK
ncbi:hypothetical protein KDK_72730 [Dictyobacter kobayashii]|uniref:MalT-like TPR region domain-containing protein n=2 Tax=Dictyobacter kobayashii TaxID=2014872 RepID=A0A402AWR9_9CHLR|nr:hypothetical protein KDK_72730 [Dictyobacter kobayashii]